MAFVPPATASTFLPSNSLQSNSLQTKCLSSRPNISARPNPPLRMAFSSIDDPSTAVALRDFSNNSKEAMITACYKHIFGNAYLMHSERAELAKIESCFKLGESDIRELVRAMGKSEAYRKRFFARSGPYRFVELNYKHFLGRGPNNHDEITMHVKMLMENGYEAEIDSYLDSDEYTHKFGNDIVPRFVFQGTYLATDNFSRMTIMRKYWDGCSTSTVSGSTAPGKPIPAQLLAGRGGYVNGFVGIMKGLPAGFRPVPLPKPKSPLPSNARAGMRVRIKIAENLYQVFEIPPMLAPVEPKWKKEREGEKRWNGVWF